MFKGLGNLAALMRNASDISGKMEGISDALRDKTVVGSAGGDMVQVEMNGLSQVTKVSIDSVLIEKQDREMLETLLPAVINQAITKAKQLHVEAMRDLTGGIDLPGLEKMMQRFTGNENPEAPDET